MRNTAMKILMLLFALNTIDYCHLMPHGGGAVIGGVIAKHGGFAVGPAAHPVEGYADSTAEAGGGIAGSGTASFSASFGGGASGGGGGEVVKTVTIEKHVPAHGYVEEASVGGGGGAVGGASFSALFGGGAVAKHHAHGGHVELVSEKVLDVETEAPAPVQPAKKTVIERTFIPNYVEKKIQVPTYVEKTIRVPAYVEKTIKVPAAPTILEKTISQEDVPAPTVHKEEKVKIKVKTRPHKIYKEVVATGIGEGGSYVGGADYLGGGGYGGVGGFGGAGLGGGGGFNAYASGGGKGFLDSIFEIPIQTLGAVRGFLNGLSGSAGFSAGGGFSKGFATY